MSMKLMYVLGAALACIVVPFFGLFALSRRHSASQYKWIAGLSCVAVGIVGGISVIGTIYFAPFYKVAEEYVCPQNTLLGIDKTPENKDSYKYSGVCVHKEGDKSPAFPLWVFFPLVFGAPAYLLTAGLLMSLSDAPDEEDKKKLKVYEKWKQVQRGFVYVGFLSVLWLVSLLFTTNWSSRDPFSFKTKRLTGVVTEVKGKPPVKKGTRCAVTVSPNDTTFNCRVQIACGKRTLYGASKSTGFTNCSVRKSRVAPRGDGAGTDGDRTTQSGKKRGEEKLVVDLAAHDPKMTSNDGDPSMKIDTKKGYVVLKDDGGGGYWEVTLQLEEKRESQE